MVCVCWLSDLGAVLLVGTSCMRADRYEGVLGWVVLLVSARAGSFVDC